MVDFHLNLDCNTKIHSNFSSKHKNQVTSPISNNTNKKLSKNTDSMLPLVASGAIAAGLLLVGLAAKKKISASSIKNVIKNSSKAEENMWKNLKFQKAETLEDAISYAENVLGIKRYNLENDIQTANWVNEGLTSLQNIYKGKFKMPDRVAFLSSNELGDTPMAIRKLNNSSLRDLVINKDFLKSNESLEHINTLLKGLEENGAIVMNNGKYKFSLIGRERYKPLFENIAELKQGTKKFGPLEINYMARGLDDYVNMCYYPNVYKDAFKNLFKDSAKMKIIKNKISDFPNLENIRKMSIDEMSDLVESIHQKTGISLDCQYGVHSFNKFDLLYHEGAHLMHETLIPDMFFKYHNSAVKNSVPKNATKELLDFLNDPNKQEIAGKISSYAKHSPLEFVAETHIGLCNGYKFSDDIMNLYKSYNGPMP